MRDELKATVQARWEDSLRARAAIAPHSPVPLLDKLLSRNGPGGTRSEDPRPPGTGRQGEDDLLGRIFLYLARFAVAPLSTAAGARRWVLASAPVPESPKAVPAAVVKTIEVRSLPWPPKPTGPVSPVPPKPELPRPPKTSTAPKTAGAPRTGTKTADLLRIAAERHGELAMIPLENCSKIATGIAAEIGMHAGSARTALLKAARAARNGGAK